HRWGDCRGRGQRHGRRHRGRDRPRARAWSKPDHRWQLWRQARQVPLQSEGAPSLSALVFEIRAEPSERLDLSPLAPQLLAGADIGEIERIRLGQSKRAARVGDVFRMAGDYAGEVVFD